MHRHPTGDRRRGRARAVPTAVLARPQPDRAVLVQAQAIPEAHWCPHGGEADRCRPTRRGLRDADRCGRLVCACQLPGSIWPIAAAVSPWPTGPSRRSASSRRSCARAALGQPVSPRRSAAARTTTGCPMAARWDRDQSGGFRISRSFGSKTSPRAPDSRQPVETAAMRAGRPHAPTAVTCGRVRSFSFQRITAAGSWPRATRPDRPSRRRRGTSRSRRRRRARAAW